MHQEKDSNQEHQVFWQKSILNFILGLRILVNRH